MGLLQAKSHIVLLYCIFAICVAHGLKTFDVQYPNFTDVMFDEAPSNGKLHREGSPLHVPEIAQSAIQLTPDSNNPGTIMMNKAGRVLYNKPFKLWEGGLNTTRVASFNTSFLVNLFPVVKSSGEGLAFLIAPGLNLMPESSHGEYLGLTNATTNGQPHNQILAIELDTVKQEFDPDDNHIGLNINSVKSDPVVSLAPLNITLAPINMSLDKQIPSYHNVWVEYDGIAKSIKVYIIRQENETVLTPPRPDSPVITSDLNLTAAVVNQYSYFGFSGSTGDTYQLNCVLRWNLTVEHYEDDDDKLAVTIGAGVSAAVVVVTLWGAAVWYYFHRKKMATTSSSILKALQTGLPGNPREFSFKELKKATNNFDVRRKLGQGGFGAVYRGSFEDVDLEIAVKWFLRESIKGQDDFLAELTIINRLRHKHLVRLLGWCHKNEKLLLVYEYMPNGSLDLHLFSGEDRPPLSWNQRYKIVSGVASALHYLHNDYDESVIHRDLKASNIMLDDDFNARLGDFGLARVLEKEKTSYVEAEGMPGTFGYIAPECFHTGRATKQSDVYSLGAVLLEVVCGQRPVTKVNRFNTLVDWVWFLHRDGILLQAVDVRLGDDYAPEEAVRLLLLGLACSHPIASERPNAQAILQMISGSVAVPYVPPFKPSFVWPALMPSDKESSITSATSVIDTSQFKPYWSESQQYLSRESSTDRSMA